MEPSNERANRDVDDIMGELRTALETRIAEVDVRLAKLAEERAELVRRLKVIGGAAPTTNGTDRLPTPAELRTLSKRESEVFRRIGSGHSTREIAKALRVHQTTVETYIRRIRAKLSIGSSTKLKYLATVHAVTS